MLVNPERFDFTVKEFDEIVVELRKLFTQRGNEYNSKSIVHDYFPFKEKSYKQMLWIKALREMNNSYPDEKTDKWKFDSIQDLIVYAMFWLDYLQKKQKQLQTNNASKKD